MTTSTIATQLEPSPALPITPSWAIPSGQGTVTLWGTVLQVVLFWCTKCVLRKEGGPWGDRGQHDSCSSPMQTSFQQPGDRGKALCQLAPPLRHRSKKHCTPFFTFLFFFFFPFGLIWVFLSFEICSGIRSRFLLTWQCLLGFRASFEISVLCLFSSPSHFCWRAHDNAVLW